MSDVLKSIVNRIDAAEFAEAERQAIYFLQSHPRHAQLWFLLGVAQQSQGKLLPALGSLLEAHGLDAPNVNIINACALSYQLLDKPELCNQMMQKAYQLEPKNTQVIANLASSFERLGQFKEALNLYDLAIEHDPDYVMAWQNRGILFKVMGEKSAWLRSNLEAYKRYPDSLEIMHNLTYACIANFKYVQALDVCNQGLAKAPENAYLQLAKGLILAVTRQFDAAKLWLANAQIGNPAIIGELMPQYKCLPESFSAEVNPSIIYFEAMFDQQQACFWEQRQDFIETLKKAILSPDSIYDVIRSYTFAFQVFSLNLSPQTRKALMQGLSDIVQDFAWLKACPPYKFDKTPTKRIRIGYISPDYRQHPTAVLCKKIFEHHDKQQFEIYTYATFGSDIKGDNYRETIQTHSHVFRDVDSMGVVELTDLVYQDKIDILVDLAGYTALARPEVFALRPAPLQISYLGFIHTLGADYMDYALADAVIIPDQALDDWHEKTIRLPSCLYVYDTDISNKPTKMLRADVGLPEHEIVFCVFNNNFKIEPVMFRVWMNILKAIPSSVIWLIAYAPEVKENLTIEAEKLGVSKERLIFASKLPVDEHLQRYQLADLFLDTYWCNAHTTAIEAVWQGLPVITCPGEVSSSRVAASIISALEMPELIMANLEDYEKTAIYYATHAEELFAMREKLKAKRYTAPLFNTELTVRQIEHAYSIVWQRYQAGLLPATTDIPTIEKNEIYH
ncbi:MAG TPA: tetratricopeptide repeat protein [Methylophilaceae bacterium]|nr:tetratricopeptide repeat protein [Methylophilaceae bacterium]